MEDEILIRQAISLHEQDRLVEAFNLIKHLPEDIIESNEALFQIVVDYEETRQLLSEFQDETDWINEKEGDIHISYKKVSGTPTISLKCEAVLDVPLFNFISLIYETELYPEWVPFCKSCKTIERVNKSKKVILSEFDVIKVANRAVCLVGYGYNLLHSDGYVMIICKSTDFYPFQTSYTLARLNFFGCLINPLTENSISVKLISNFDPNVYLLPYSLLNWLVRKFSRVLFKKLVKKSQEFNNSVYQERMNIEENKEFYNHLQVSLQEYLLSIKNK